MSGSGPEPTRANEGAKSALGGKAALGRHNVEAWPASQSIWRSEQQQEECSIGLAFGRGSVGFGALHDGYPFGRAYAPPPFSTALLQHHFEGRKSISHGEGLARHHPA
jgi:hypothetical protein